MREGGERREGGRKDWREKRLQSKKAGAVRKRNDRRGEETGENGGSTAPHAPPYTRASSL